MNRTRPYINRFVKQKQQEIEDSYHSANLRDIKPITSKLMEHSETIVINNSKRQMLKEVRELEIERENKVLLQKISSVMSKKGAYSVAKTKNIRTKINKSLNQFYRKRQLEQIEEENKKFVWRLQQKKPTLNTDKLNKDWVDNKKVIEKMANFQFNLTSIKSSSRVRSLTLDKFYKSKYDKVNFSKVKLFDGKKMLIKVEFTEHLLKIVGDLQDNKDLKIIEIPREEAIVFLEKDCHGKAQNILEKLKYDAPNQTLYLLSNSVEEGDLDYMEFNPEIDQLVPKKLESSTKKKGNRIIHNKSYIDSNAKETNTINKETIQPQNQTIAVVQQKDKEIHKKSHEKKVESKFHHEKHHQQPSPAIHKEEQARKEEQKPKITVNEQKKQAKVTVQIKEKGQEQRVIQKDEEVLQPQSDKYQEQKFQESHNTMKQAKEKIEQKSEKAQPKEEGIGEVIIEPQNQENYIQEFSANEANAESPQKVKNNQQSK